MSFPHDNEDVDRLTASEAALRFDRVFDQLREFFLKDGPNDALINLIYLMDTLDQDDFWGTEGWRHYFLGEKTRT